MLKTVIIKNKYESTIEKLKETYEKIDESGNVFILFKNEYNQNKNIEYSFLDIIGESIKIGYSYINTIVAPHEEDICGDIDNVIYVIWICKNYSKMFFDKDKIREEHIWKDVEWGKRAKNYNPKGKDPGNVWIPTEDNGKGKITKHIYLSIEDIIERIVSATTDNTMSDTVKIYSNKDINLEKIKNKTNCIVEIAYEKNEEEKENIISSVNKCHDNPTEIKKQLKETDATVIFATSEKMEEIENESLDLIVTSPPYWNLKDYFKEGQIGQEPYEEYLFRMNKVWKECYNKLKNTGSLWININIRRRNNKPILLPKDFITQCKTIGYHFKGILIWHKSSGIPTHAKNIVDRHEYVLIFSKDVNFSLNKEKLNKYSDYKNTKINGKMFWNINRKAGSVGKNFIHPAIYPNDLVRRIIEVATDNNDYVMDPFLGSGTSLIPSLQLNRNFIGYEYNDGFRELMEHRFENEVSEYSEKIRFVYRKKSK